MWGLCYMSLSQTMCLSAQHSFSIYINTIGHMKWWAHAALRLYSAEGSLNSPAVWLQIVNVYVGYVCRIICVCVCVHSGLGLPAVCDEPRFKISTGLYNAQLYLCIVCTVYIKLFNCSVKQMLNASLGISHQYCILQKTFVYL